MTSDRISLNGQHGARAHDVPFVINENPTKSLKSNNCEGSAMIRRKTEVMTYRTIICQIIITDNTTNISESRTSDLDQAR